MASPSPAPVSPWCCTAPAGAVAALRGVRALPPRQPVSNTRARSCSSMPPQPSVTDTTTSRSSRRAATATVPSTGVDRIALISRLPRTRVISRLSTSTGAGATRSPTRRTPRSRASGWAPAMASPTRS